MFDSMAKRQPKTCRRRLAFEPLEDRHLLAGDSLVARPIISELMADNGTTLADEDGQYADWIELWNPSDETINLEGYFLTDNPDALAKWPLPAATLAADERLLIFASGKDRSAFGAPLHTNFKLRADGEFLALVAPGGTTITSAFSPEFPAQVRDVSYGVTAAGSVPRFFTNPTPGATNDPSGVFGSIGDTRFSVDRGIYSESFDVQITADVVEATIYFTTDGSAPSPENPLAAEYAGPIQIATTTTLRAAAYLEGYLPTNIDTQTYVFIADVLSQSQPENYPTRWGSNGSVVDADYDIDPRIAGDPLYRDRLTEALTSLPTLSLVGEIDDIFGPQGIYSKPLRRGADWEIPISVELIDPGGGEFQIDAGLRIRGGTGRFPQFPKHSFRLAFRGEYGDGRLDFPLFPNSTVRSFNTIALRAGFNNTWAGNGNSEAERAQYLRDEFARRTQLDMGQLSSNGRFVHLYVNGLYWGLYDAVERSDAAFAAEHLGGEPEEWDAVASSETNFVDGDSQAWDAMWAIADQGLAGDDLYQQIQGNNPDGTRNLDYPVYVNVENLADYMLLNFFIGNKDWDGNNWSAARRRGEASEGFLFFAWDSERTLESISGDDRTGLDTDRAPSGLFRRLMENDQFARMFQNRVHTNLNSGVLRPEQNIARYQALAEEIDLAVIAESARWGDVTRSEPYTRDAEWVAERDRILTQYFPQRNDIVIRQLRDAGFYPPVDAPRLRVEGVESGGVVTPGTQLQIISPGQPAPDVWYTTGGDDPRGADGSPAATAAQFGSSLGLTESVTVKARSYAEGQWSALDEVTYTVAPSLRISEIMYHPADPPAGSNYTNSDFEFIELQNVGNSTIDLTGIRLVGGVEFDLSSTGLTTLRSAERLVVVSNLLAFISRYDFTSMTIAGIYTGRLSNGGETVSLLSQTGDVIQRVGYDDSWYRVTDGDGSSLVAVDLDTTAVDWSFAEAWRGSHYPDGTPGADDPLRLPGDFNDDGRVGLLDLARLVRNFGRRGVATFQGDADGDGSVGRSDIASFARSLSSTTPAAPASLIAGVSAFAQRESRPIRPTIRLSVPTMTGSRLTSHAADRVIGTSRSQVAADELRPMRSSRHLPVFFRADTLSRDAIFSSWPLRRGA